MRTSRYKFVRRGTGELQLYDLAADPYELQNQHGNPAYAEIESALASRLEALRDCAGETCRAQPPASLELFDSREAALVP